MFEKDTENIISQMSSFYQDNLPMDSRYTKLLEVYIHTLLPLWEEVKYLDSHLNIDSSPTLHKITYAKVSVAEVLYTKNEALEMLKFNTLEERIRELDRKERYVQLRFSELGSRTPKVYSCTVKSRFDDTDDLLLYEDYFIRDNKIYILPNFILRTEKVTKEFHLFDIYVDNMLLEKKWGTYFNIETGSLISRSDYRNVLSALHRLLMSRLTIRDIKEAIALATGWEGFDVVDIKSPHIRPSIKKLYDDWRISPARFVTIVPEEIIADKIRLNILLSILDEAKEEQTNYLIIFDISRTEDIGEFTKDVLKKMIRLKNKDFHSSADDSLVKPTVKKTDIFFPVHRYDYGRRYDVRMIYNSTGGSEEDAVLDSPYQDLYTDEELLMDQPWKYKTEYATIRHSTFPEIPRLATLEITEGDEVKISVRANDDGTEYFEVLGSDEEYGIYESVGIFANDEVDATANSLNVGAISGSKRYYKVKAISGLYVSLPTKALDVQNPN